MLFSCHQQHRKQTRVNTQKKEERKDNAYNNIINFNNCTTISTNLQLNYLHKYNACNKYISSLCPCLHRVQDRATAKGMVE